MKYMSIYDSLHKNRNLINFTSIAFFSMIILGMMFPNFQLDFQNEIISSLKTTVDGKGFWEITIFIIKNNITTAFISILFGILFIPIVTIMINGFFIGAVLSRSMAITSASVLKLLPHGIFEIPAIIIAFSYGIRIGISWFSPNPIKSIKENYVVGFTIFIYLVVPLLIVAGFIEGAMFTLLQG